MKRLRRWILSRVDAQLAAVRTELAATEKDRDAIIETLDGVNRTCREIMAERDAAERLLRAVMKGIEFDPLDPSWKESPAAAMHSVGAHVDTRLSVERRRASEAEAAAEDLRRENRDLGRSLENEQRAHEKTKHEAECIKAENRLLATIHETDVQRRAAERAIEVRREAEAEAAANELRGDERE